MYVILVSSKSPDFDGKVYQNQLCFDDNGRDPFISSDETVAKLFAQRMTNYNGDIAEYKLYKLEEVK